MVRDRGYLVNLTREEGRVSPQYRKSGSQGRWQRWLWLSLGVTNRVWEAIFEMLGTSSSGRISVL